MANRDMRDCGLRLDAGDVFVFDFDRALGFLAGEAERQARRIAGGEVSDIEYMGGSVGSEEERWTEVAGRLRDLQRRSPPVRNEKLPVS